MSRRKQKSREQRRLKQPVRQQPAPQEPAPATIEKRIIDWGAELIRALVTGICALAIGGINQRIYDLGTAQPWTILWIAIPLAIVVAVSWSTLRRRKLTMHWVFWLFLGLYCTLFIILSTSDVLAWRREKVDTATPLSRQPTMLAALNGWRYKVLRPASSVGKPMVIVMLEPRGMRTWEDVRYDKLRLMQLVRQTHGVAGVAFDFYFSWKTQIDGLLCDEIRAALKPNEFTVLSGFKTVVADDGTDRIWPPADALEECLPRGTQQGHVMALQGAEGEVRELPVSVVTADHVALSVRIAQALSKEQPSLPADGRLRFVPPADVIQEFSLADIEEDVHRLSNRFVVVGERSETDMYPTPFGLLSGTRIHAYAAHTVLANSYIVRPPGWVSAAFIIANCYLVTLFTAFGWSARRLCLLAAGLTAGVMLLSVLAMILFRVWLDVAYVIAALWILIFCMLGLRSSMPSLSLAPQPAR